MERITTNFGFSSTAAEVIEGVDLGGKRVIVTGGASGIVLETAKALSVAGAAVTLAVRRPAAARTVAEDIRVSTGNNAVEGRSLDVSDLASEDCSEASVVDRRPDNFGGGVAPYALDSENAERLWSLPTAMLAP
jgi:NAD(P)-dependent dehydrogenase (short-subunit alcohol dehydrogenase family)